MIYSDAVEHLEIVSYPLTPPGVSVLLHSLPRIKRISPKLTVLAEIIGRNSRNAFWSSVLPHIKEVLVGKNVCAVGGNVYRDITDYKYSLFICVLSYLIPLAEKFVLNKLPHKQSGFIIIIFLEIKALCSPVCLLQCHKKTEVSKSFVLCDIRLDFFLQLVRDTLRSLFQQRQTCLCEEIIFTNIRCFLLQLVKLFLCDKTFVKKLLNIYKIRISRECRIGLIGGVTLVGHTEREHLPISKARIR